MKAAVDIKPGALRAALRANMHQTTRLIALWLAVLYAFFALAHLAVLPPGVSGTMSALAIASALLLLGIWWRLGRLPATSRWVHAVGGLTAGVVIANSLVHLYLIPDPKLTTNLLLIVVASGYLFLSTPWFGGVAVAAAVGWGLVATLSPPSPDWTHFGFAMLTAIVVGAAIHWVRLRTTERAERARLEEETLRAALEQALLEKEDALRQKEASLQAAEELAVLKASILDVMSHEVRTPLTGIIGFAEVLQDDTEGDAHFIAETIGMSARRLLETLNGVLDLSRLEAGGVPLELRPVDLAEKIREQLHLFDPLADRKGLDLRLDAEPDASFHARADPSAFDRVLTNLVSNALKFTDAGAVTVELARDEGNVVLRVHDTGIGIGPGFLPHVFEPFRQESTGLARSHEGSGLGLSITKRLVELMNGHIDVDSRPGEGTTFTVRLEAAPSKEGQTTKVEGREIQT